MLKNETKAPEFSLPDANGQPLSLGQFSGKPVVLLFVRGAFCPTTDRFLTAWQDFYNRVKDLGMELVSISADSVETNAAFAERFKIAFPLLSDSDLVVSKQYGVYAVERPNKTFGEPAIIIVDKDGHVAYSVISSGPKGLPDPGVIAPILIYMHAHGGKY